MQTVTQVALEGGAVQEWHEEVDAREVKVDELVDQVWLWEREIDRAGVDVKRAAFPLLTPMSQAKQNVKEVGRQLTV